MANNIISKETFINDIITLYYKSDLKCHTDVRVYLNADGERCDTESDLVFSEKIEGFTKDKFVARLETLYKTVMAVMLDNDKDIFVSVYIVEYNHTNDMVIDETLLGDAYFYI